MVDELRKSGMSQQEGSFFCLEGDHWVVVTMDTAQHDANPLETVTGAALTWLDPKEAEWVRDKVAKAKASGKKVLQAVAEEEGGQAGGRGGSLRFTTCVRLACCRTASQVIFLSHHQWCTLCSTTGKQDGVDQALNVNLYKEVHEEGAWSTGQVQRGRHHAQHAHLPSRVLSFPASSYTAAQGRGWRRGGVVLGP